MKLAAIVLGTAVFSTSAVTSLSAQADEYEYRGARTAAAVCQAVPWFLPSPSFPRRLGNF